MLKPFGYFKHPVQVAADVKATIDALDLDDINRILFRCDEEEKSDGFGVAAYNLSHVGPMIYCGLQGNHLNIFQDHWEKRHKSAKRWWAEKKIRPTTVTRFVEPCNNEGINVLS